MIVVDASVLATALGDDTDDGARMRRPLRDQMLAAPEIVDLEVLTVWRRQRLRRELTNARAARALADLRALPLRCARHGPLLDRCWQLRDTVTAYDAVYVALAEALEVPLVTADGRLARASGPRCAVELVT